jgi:hypothetical protein
MAVPCRNAAHRRTRQRRITRRFPNATVRTQRTLHHHNVSAWRPKADKTTHSNKNYLLSI